jgi:hypothetical protein
VTALAVCFVFIDQVAACPHIVFMDCYRLQMFWVAARPVATQMVNNKAIGYVPLVSNVRQPMCRPFAAIKIKLPIAFLC